MKKLIIISVFILVAKLGFSQQVITVSADTVIQSTYKVSSNTILDLNDHKVQFFGSPQELVSYGATLLIKDGTITNFNQWGTTHKGAFEWRLHNSKGTIWDNGVVYNTSIWLDGVPK